MSFRAKIIIIIVVGVILALLIWLMVAGRRTIQTVSSPPFLDRSESSQPSSPTTLLSTSPALRTGTPSLDAFARAFVERYGSFSNQSGFANLKELRPFMTEALRQEVEAMMASGASANIAYAGTTTKALTIKEQKVEKRSATFLISTQRRESTAQNPNARVYYQDIELSLLKAGDDWKVNRAVWK